MSADKPATTNKKPSDKEALRGLRTFAADRDALQPKEKIASAKTTTPTKVVTPKSAPATVPKSAVTKPVTKLDETGEKIPAFHELKHKPVEPEKTPAKIAIDDTEGAFGGTVITDTKKDRFKLFPALGASISAWWKKITTKKKKNTPTYAVPDSSLRKGVIQKATSKTGAFFTADAASLKERIKERNTTPEPTPPQTTASTQEEASVSWSANTDTGYALLENQPNKPAPLPKPEVPAPEPKKSKPVPVPTPPPAPQQTATAQKADSTKSAPTRDEWVYNPSEEEQAPPPPRPQLIKTPPPVQTPLADLPDISTPRPRTSTTNKIVIGVFLAIIACFILFILGKNVYDIVQAQRAASLVFEEQTDSILSRAPQQDMIISDLSVLAIQEVVRVSQAQSGRTVRELRLLLGEDVPVLPSRFFSIISTDLDPALTETLEDVRLAVSDHPTQGVLLRVKDSKTTQGGLLAFEPTMHESLSTIFQNRSTTSTLSKFVDERIESIDVRVLYTTDYEAKVVYGFINDTTVLITPDREQFELILNHL